MTRGWAVALPAMLLLGAWPRPSASASLRPAALVRLFAAAFPGPMRGTWTVWAPRPGNRRPLAAGLPLVRRAPVTGGGVSVAAAAALARPLVTRGLASEAALVLRGSFRGSPALGYRRVLRAIARARGRAAVADVGPAAGFVGALVPGVAPPVDVAGRWMNVLVSFTYDRHHGRTGVRMGTP